MIKGVRTERGVNSPKGDRFRTKWIVSSVEGAYCKRVTGCGEPICVRKKRLRMESLLKSKIHVMFCSILSACTPLGEYVSLFVFE